MTATDGSSVTIAWSPSRARDLDGYGVYANGAKVGTVTPDQVRRWRDRDVLSYTIRDLACGTGYTVGVDAFDRDDNHSDVTTTTVSTAACPDRTSPSAPSGVRQVATTESSVLLAWNGANDNVGVVEYGLYVGGLRVSTVSETTATVTKLACNTSYLIGLDAADAAGNRSNRVDAYFRTSACPSTNKPPSTPNGLKVTGATPTSVTLGWSASTDDGSVVGYGLYLDAARKVDTTSLSGTVSGLQCGKTFTFGVDAVDNAALRSPVAQLSAATSACPSSSGDTTAPTVSMTAPGTGSTVSGTIVSSVNASDNVGVTRVDFYRDGSKYATDSTPPFSVSVNTTGISNGSHGFGAQAFDAAGNVGLAPFVTATVSNTTSSSGDTTAPTVPGNVRVVSATVSSVTIAWNASTDSTGVAGYGTYRGTSAAGQTQQLTTTFSGMTCGTAYPVGVDAYDAAGNRSARADLQVTTSACPDSQPPTAPTNVTATTRTATSIALTWSASTDNQAVGGYAIYNAGELVNTTNGTTGIVSGLSCGTNYTLAVDAFDMSGNSSTKTTIMVATLACDDTTAPTVSMTAPGTGSTVSGTIVSSVNASDNVGVTRVDFYRDGSKYATDSTPPFSVSVDTTGISNGSHGFGAQAFDAAGNVGLAPFVTATVSNTTSSSGDTTAPTVPGNLRLSSATTTSVTVAWNAATDNVAVTGYDVYRATTKVGSTATTSYTISGLTCATTYSVGVKALDAAGNASPQATTSATTASCSPPASTSCATSTKHVPDGPDGMGGCWPGPANTGPNAPESSMTAYTGACNITTANVRIDSKVIRCDIVVGSGASGLVISNSYIYGAVHGNGGSFTVQDSYMDGTKSDGFSCVECGIDGPNLTVLRTEVNSTNRAIYCENNCMVRDSYLHTAANLNPARGDHASGMRMEQNSTLIHNSIGCRYTGPFSGPNVNPDVGCSADISGYPDFVPIHHNTVDSNLLLANVYAAYCIYAGGTSGKPYSNDPQNATYVVVKNNVWQRGTNARGCAYGPITSFMSGRTGNVWTNNTWDDGTSVAPAE